MQTIKTVGKSGQISLGKALAGLGFIVEEIEGGDFLLKRAVVVPMNERWVHESEMKSRLADADAWMQENPATKTDVKEIEASLGSAK